MITKHFLRTLIVFTGMIVLGLIGVFLVSYLDNKSGNKGEPSDSVNNKTQVAK